MTTTASPRFHTVSQFARLLGVSRSHVLELIAEGRLRSVRFGPNAWHRIPVEELDRLVVASDPDQPKGAQQ